MQGVCGWSSLMEGGKGQQAAIRVHVAKHEFVVCASLHKQLHTPPPCLYLMLLLSCCHCSCRSRPPLVHRCHFFTSPTTASLLPPLPLLQCPLPTANRCGVCPAPPPPAAAAVSHPPPSATAPTHHTCP
jgi:hypothetical protein